MVVSAVPTDAPAFGSTLRLVHVHSVPDFLVFSALAKADWRENHSRYPRHIAGILCQQIWSQQVNSLQIAGAGRVSIGKISDHVIIANDLWHQRLVARSASAESCTIDYQLPGFRSIQARRTAAADACKFPNHLSGHLNTHQGVDIAVRAMHILRDELPQAEFHVYGEGPAKPLMELTSELALSDKVIFHNFLPCDQIPGAMALSDVAVVPKRASSPFGNEAMSTKIMEFMSLGVPVIVSANEG